MARILIVDDDEGVRSALRWTLDQFGHTVIEARDGNEGLEVFPEAKVDLLITDLVMPGKSGLELLAELQKKYSPVKAIAISGGFRHGGEDVLQVAKSLGAAKVLAKPFTVEALMRAVNELLSDGGAGVQDLAH